MVTTTLGSFWSFEDEPRHFWGGGGGVSNNEQISSDVVLHFTPHSFSFFASYDSMWSKFNALFVVYPMGHFTVGWVGG